VRAIQSDVRRYIEDWMKLYPYLTAKTKCFFLIYNDKNAISMVSQKASKGNVRGVS